MFVTELGRWRGLECNEMSRGRSYISDRADLQALGGLLRAEGGDLPGVELVSATGLAPANIRKRLRELRALDLVVQHGGPGLATTYERTAD